MDERVNRFLGVNRDLSYISDDGVILRFLTGWKSKGWIEMHIVVDEDTAIDAIRCAWPLILEWRRRLQEWQGLWTAGGDNQFYETMRTLKERGWSYRRIATWVNAKIADYLWRYTEYTSAAETAAQDPGAGGYWGLKRADSLLNLARPAMSDIERQEVLAGALQEIEEGSQPFYMDDDPVMGDEIRARLRQWKKKQGEGW